MSKITDTDLLRLQDSLGCDIENFLRSSHGGKTLLSNDDVRLLYDVVVQFREAAKNERERFAKWCRDASAFHETQSRNDEMEAGIAYAYSHMAHQLEENYITEIQKIP